MKNLENLEFQEISIDESRNINGGVIALVVTTAGLCYALFRSIVTNPDSLS